ncbi:MAG: RluA family pseudouridine synthase [Spirochaetaceae bacterium]|jgi:23S rRNA pseudouridine955/2504/2580 synthase|nr:RluA family pseudouridine synthase [Spirochaetaceae bacterium]
MTRIAILYEDQRCLVLNKPAGLPVQGGERVKTSLDALLAREYDPPPRLVHRLDKDSSGVILVAKTPLDAAHYSKIIAGGRAVKEYLAVVACDVDPHAPRAGVIKTTLSVKGRDKYAETGWRILRQTHAPEGAWTTLRLRLHTGRTHQIRRSLAQEGRPILGDDKYGDFALNRRLRKERGLKNLLLHSARLAIPQSDGPPIDVSAPPPPYFDEYLR